MTPRPPALPSRRRPRRPRSLLLVAALLAGALAPAVSAGAAGALPSSCSDGMPPPCIEIPDPDDDPPPPPPSSTWTTAVELLDQGVPRLSGGVQGRWVRGAPPYQMTPPGTVAFDGFPAGHGTLRLTGATLPSGQPVSLRLFQDGSGPLCRTPPRTSIPPSGATTRVLIGPPVTKSAAEVQEMVSDLPGRRYQVDGTQATIDTASAIPEDDGLHIRITGGLYRDVQFPLPNFDANFGYEVVLGIGPAFNVGDQTLSVTAPTPGTLLVGPKGLDDEFLSTYDDWVNGSHEAEFRSAVISSATETVNRSVADDTRVQWFTSLGYSVSMRDVVTSSEGITLHPSFCTLD